MRAEDCFYLGHIRKPHGIRGELKVYFDVDNIEDYSEQESVYVLRDEKLAPVFIESMRLQGPQIAIVQFRGCYTRNEAEILQGLPLYLPIEELPELDGPGQFYYHEITGFRVVDQELGELGTVLRVDEMPAQDVIVMQYKGKEVLIPVTYDFVLEADRSSKIMRTRLPEGLVDIYLVGSAEGPKT